MSEIIIGGLIEGKIKILDLRDIWRQRRVIEVREFIEFKGCKMVEVGWHDEFSTETLDRLTEVINLSTHNDIYDIAHFIKEDWRIYIAVPRDYVVILDKGMGRVNLKYLGRELEIARYYDKKHA